MIVGINGVAGAGKDTFADYLVEDANFVKIALADPLKRICLSVFREFTENDLWGPSEERNKPNRAYPTQEKTYDLCPECKSPVVAWSHQENYGWKCPNHGGIQFYLTPRYALQQLGTEWGRKCHDQIWVKNTMADARSILSKEEHYEYDPTKGVQECPCTNGEDFHDAKRNPRPEIDGVAVSDVRFHNEVDGIRRAGGLMIRIKREGAGLQGTPGQHASETEQLGMPDHLFDVIVLNNGSQLDLRRKVPAVIKRLQLVGAGRVV
jgi:hypothetical protein